MPKLWYHMNCSKLDTVIKIQDAWDYLNKCTYKFMYMEMDYLYRKCNGKYSCDYARFQKWRTCYQRSSYTNSTIMYKCVNRKNVTTPTISTETTKRTTTTEFTTQYYTSSSHIYSPSNISTRPQSEHQTFSASFIAGSVFGVLGILALLLLLLYCIWKRRKAIKQNDTSPRNTMHAVGQNSNILYVVSENISPHTHDPPPAYSTLYPNPDQDHICINNEAIMNTNSERQQANDYNHIHGAHINNSIQNNEYNHTDTGLNLPGRPGEEYNHISVSGRNVVTENQMDDGYNHIRNTEDMSHSLDDYNHINGQTGGQENKGYLNDDYNHPANSNGPNMPEREQMDGYEDQKQRDVQFKE